MNKILVIGRQGQLARELAFTLAPIGQVSCLGRPEFDATEIETLNETIAQLAPDVIINASAYTAVDKAEQDSDAAFLLNATAVKRLAETAKALSIPLIHYSTDYVFAGTGTQPWSETDSTSPQGVYARSKREGEQAIEASQCAHFIFRTAWVYGHYGHNFYKTMRRLALEREEMKVVDDQRGSPTWSYMIALATSQIIAQGLHLDAGRGAGNSKDYLLNFVSARSGTYHMTADGACSWYEFARQIIETDPQKHLHKVRTLKPISTEEFPTPARRPANSVLSNEKCFSTFGIRLPHWQSQLALVQSQLK
jgi:dTDP-4-dehydrorhamnose reductase